MSTLRIATDAQLPAIARELAGADLVAVDTEFHAERRYGPTLLLLQLHIPGGGLHLIDPLMDGALDQIAHPLRGTDWLVHAGRQDLRLLHAALGGVPARVYDTQIAAGLASPFYPSGYTDLLRDWTGVDVEKAATLSDWSRRPLGDEQLAYAADDVRLLPKLWEALVARLRELDRYELALEACEEARSDALSTIDRNALWTLVGAAPMLDGPGRAVLQELCRWRDEVAETTDTPARSVLSDGLAVDLAKRRPTSVNRILSNRRFPRRLAQRLGPDLIEIIERACARSESDWPRAIRPQTHDQRVHDMLRLVAQVHGADHHWSTRLVVPDDRLGDLVLEPPATQLVLEERLGPWRSALVGTTLWDTLRGAITLGLRDGAPRLDPHSRQLAR